MRRLALLTLAVAVCLVEVGQAGADPPADPPGPVSRFTDVFASAYMDPADGLVALGGPPPEQGCFGQGFDDPADFQIVELPSGPIKILIRDVDQPMWLYEASSIEEICEAVFAGMIPEPVASGTVRTVLNDNDADVSLTRSNAFGDTSTGILQRADGTACHFSASFRAIVTKKDEFRVLKEDIRSNC
jgi:hypothetical protein